MASSQWDNSPPKFTEFGPLSSDVKPSGNFLTRLLRRSNSSKDDPDVVTSAPGSLTASREPSLERHDSLNTFSTGVKFPFPVQPTDWGFKTPSNEDVDTLSGESETSQGTAPADQKRTLTSVLSQISNILERRSATPQTYKDSDFRQYWMPDSSCRECYDCGDKFTTFRRRHHCRICGQIFCSKCCNQELPGKVMGYRGNLRVCTYCCRVVLSCIQQSGVSGELRLSREDLRSLPQMDPVDDYSGSYQEFGWWTPVLRRRSLVREDSKLGRRSSSTPDLVKATKSGNPFDFNPHMGMHSAESIQIERKLLVQDSQQLKLLWRSLMDPEKGIQLQSHRVRLRMYTNCIVGTDVVAWLEENKSASREQAVAIGQALLDAAFIEPIISQEGYPLFHDDFTLYKAGEAAINLEMSPVKEEQSLSFIRDESMEPLWVQEIESNDDEVSLSEENKIPALGLKLDTADSVLKKIEEDVSARSTFYVSQNRSSGELDSSPASSRHSRQISIDKVSMQSDEPFPRQDSYATGLTDDFLTGALFSRNTAVVSPTEAFTCPPGWRTRDQLRDENGEKLAFIRLQKAHEEHRVGLLKQLLSQANLSLTWSNLLLKILSKVTEYVRPDIRTEGDNMDLRKYVQVKKIPGDQKQSTSLYHGVVFTKNVAHKKMAQVHINPKILLLKGSIEYQRVENKFSSLDPQILQEREFLKRSVDKITGVFKPDVVLVEKTVSRLAQEFLLEQGITLCFNVKPAVMERIARFTQADIVNSIDGLVSRPTLGICHMFKVKTFTLPNGEQKTLMFFDGCATHLGCTITLRGGSSWELKRVKKILNYTILAAYHSCLEVSFCMDEFALPPPAPDERALSLEGLDSSTETEDGRQPIFSPQSNLSSAAMFQIEVASRLQAKSDPMADSFLAGITQELAGAGGHLVADESFNPGDSTLVIDDIQPNDSTETVKQSFSDGDTSTQTSEAESDTVTNSQDATLPIVPQIEVSGMTSAEKHTEPKLDNKENVSPRLPLKDIPKRKSAEITELKDFSDPLHNYQQSKDESIFHSRVALTEQKLKRPYLIRKAVDGTTLSLSPYFKFELPYLETEIGSKCELRKYFPEQVYWSKLLDVETSGQSASKNRSSTDVDNSGRHGAKQNVEILPAHPLILTQLNNPASDRNIQALLADFRARGGRIKLSSNNDTNTPPIKESSNKGATTEESKDSLSGATWEKQVDCLDPANHQRLGVLFSSYSYVSANAPYPCVAPWVVMMDYYGKNDITLGGFLERFCFRESYTCPSEGCETAMFDHIRRFVHGNGCIYVILRKLDNLIPGGQTNILMWSWCRKCKQVTPVVSMSVDTWSMSFAKYLDMRFHGNSYRRRASAEPCAHSLHHDHYQYFGFMGTVASFKFSPISLREISLPPPVVRIHDHKYHVKYLIDETMQLNHRGSKVYSDILEHMVKLKSEVQHDTQMKVISEHMATQQTEKGELRELAQTILNTLETLGNSKSEEIIEGNEPEKVDKVALRYEIVDNICQLKRMVAEAVLDWNAKIQDFIQQQRKLEKSKSQVTVASKKEKDFVENSTDSLPKPDMPEGAGSLPSIEEPQIWSTASSGEFSSRQLSRSDTGNTDERALSTSSVESYVYGVTPGISAGIWPMEWSEGQHSPYSSSYVVCNAKPEVKSPFEVIVTGDVFKEPDAASSESKSLPKSDSEASQNVEHQSEPDLQVKGHSRQGSGGSQIVKKDSKSTDEVDAGSKQEKKGSSVKWSLISLLSGPGFIPVQMPFPPDEHHTLPLCQTLPVIVYDQEPSSIIAYSLSCFDYHNHLAEIQCHLHRETQNASPYNARRGFLGSSGKSESVSSTGEDIGKKAGGRVLSFFRGSQSNKDKSPKLTKKIEMVADSVKYTPWTEDSLDGTVDDPMNFLLPINSESDRSKSSKQPFSFHVELQFFDSSSRFYCRVYFAEQFRQLRKFIFPAGEEMFIRSISRCVAWKAKGGKSGSAFCKTTDDRFILKQMSAMEVESFEKFAPNYFNYMTEAHTKQKPTALAKILGVYRIGFRNSQTNSAMKQDLLVMENLFYDRKITQTFDLKGSVRNRLVNTTGKREDELVLLDENLLKASVDQPLYIRQHSKAVLTEAIARDTQFLSTNLVMDYSLLVGVDDTKKDLVVGIIDYIRTFTWDKKLEMVVKYTGIFGGQGKMPTVVSPELYKSRFLEAMDRYFLMVPDRWTGLGKDSENMV